MTVSTLLPLPLHPSPYMPCNEGYLVFRAAAAAATLPNIYNRMC